MTGIVITCVLSAAVVAGAVAALVWGFRLQARDNRSGHRQLLAG